MPENRVQDLVARARRLLQPLDPVPTGALEEVSPLAGVRALLFDIYGTVLVSASGDVGAGDQADHERTFRAAANAAGIAVFDVAPMGVDERFVAAVRAHHARARASGVDVPEVEIRYVWRELLAAWRSEGRLGEWTDGGVEVLALEFECRANPVWCMPGFPGMLERLKDGLALGIVSNAQFYTPIVLEALTGRSLRDLGFEPDLCAWSWEQRCAKPSPRLLGGVLARLAERGIGPGQVAFIGNDTARDIVPARDAGCRTILFAGDRRSLRVQAGVKPDAVITDLSRLPPLLGRGPAIP